MSKAQDLIIEIKREAVCQIKNKMLATIDEQLNENVSDTTNPLQIYVLEKFSEEQLRDIAQFIRSFTL